MSVQDLKNHHSVMHQLIFNLFKGLNINAANATGRIVERKIPDDMRAWLRDWISHHPTEAAVAKLAIGTGVATIVDIKSILRAVFKMSDVNANLGDDILDDFVFVLTNAIQEALMGNQSGAFVAATQTAPAQGPMRIMKEKRESTKRWMIHGDAPCGTYDTALAEGTSSKTVFDEVEVEGNDKNKKGKKVRKPREEQSVPTVITTTPQAAARLMGKAGYKVCPDCNAWKLITKALVDEMPHEESRTLRAAFLHMALGVGAAEEAADFLNEIGARERLEQWTEYHGQMLPEDVRRLFLLPKKPELPESNNLDAVETQFLKLTEDWRARIERSKAADKEAQLNVCREALQNMEEHRASMELREIFTPFLAFNGPWTEIKIKDFFLSNKDFHKRNMLIINAANEFAKLQKVRDEKVLKPWNDECEVIRTRRARLFQEVDGGLRALALEAEQKAATDKEADEKKQQENKLHNNAEKRANRRKAQLRGQALGLTPAQSRGDFSEVPPTLVENALDVLTFGLAGRRV